MATFDYLHSRTVADRLIQKFGMQASLRRNDIDRPCWLVIVRNDAREQPTDFTNLVDQEIIVSAGLFDLYLNPPVKDVDQVVFYLQPPGNPPVVQKVSNITTPVDNIAPANIDVAYQFTVRR